MNMKILKEGKLEEHKAICKHCGCEFLYDRKDIYIEWSAILFVYCPTCGRRIDVDSNTYEPILQEDIRR